MHLEAGIFVRLSATDLQRYLVANSENLEAKIRANWRQLYATDFSVADSEKYSRGLAALIRDWFAADITVSDMLYWENTPVDLQFLAPKFPANPKIIGDWIITRGRMYPWVR